MALYLDEDHYGCDSSLIGFRHILLCMAIVVVENKKAYGIHITKVGLSSDKAVASFKQYLDKSGAKAGDCSALYGCCDRKIRYGAESPESKWKAEMTKHAEVLGYKGAVLGFDTSIISPKDGTYIEFRPNFPKKACSIFYKRNEKMKYETGPVPSSSSGYIKRYSTVRGPVKANIVTQSAEGKKNWRHKGTLHEVDYAKRLTKFDV